MVDEASNPGEQASPAVPGEAGTAEVQPSNAGGLHEAVKAAVAAGGTGRRFRSLSNFSPLAMGIAIAVHAALIGVGVYFYRSYTDPKLSLPQGWANKQEGITAEESDATGVREAPPLTLSPPPGGFLGAPTTVAPSQLGAPPAEFEPPMVTPVQIKASGTIELGPLLGLPTPQTGAPSSGRRPPGSDAGAGDAPDAKPNPGAGTEGNVGAPAASTTSASQAPPARAVANGDGDGTRTGGAIGVPDGDPVPSSQNRVPRYPELARQHGWWGTVRLALDIRADGRVGVSVIQSSGHDVLDREAVECAETWRFTPATRGGQAVAVSKTRDINFLPPK